MIMGLIKIEGNMKANKLMILQGGLKQ